MSPQTTGKTLTLRLEGNFHRRLKTKLAAEGTSFQAKVESLLRDYVDGPTEEREALARQVELAREVMRQYAPALRELAR